jgi:DNA-binding GntR family transcriptional regulator
VKKGNREAMTEARPNGGLEAEQGLAEHTAIFAALAARDPERAEGLMRQHILRSAEQTGGTGLTDTAPVPRNLA